MIPRPDSLPPPLAPFLTFVQVLRQEGFAAAPEQLEGFLAATSLLGPASIRDIRRAAHAVFGPGPDRREGFDDIFDQVFMGRAFLAPAEGEAEDLPESYDAGEFDLIPEPDEEDPSGAEATGTERLFARMLTAEDPEGLLRAFSRALPRVLPTRRSRRMAPGRGGLADPARAFREMVRRDGEITRLPERRRRRRQRRVLLLVDVSGSMKSGTEGAMRLAHALTAGAERAETFTLGTRLTRVTKALRHRNREQALSLAAGLVADWDGGTRLGDALAVFLTVPRFAAFARGALVVVVSDGLERGGPEALVHAMERLRGLAWGILWLTPLAADPGFQPRTGAMQAILPLVDRIGDGSRPEALAREILAFSKGARDPRREPLQPDAELRGLGFAADPAAAAGQVADRSAGRLGSRAAGEAARPASGPPSAPAAGRPAGAGADDAGPERVPGGGAARGRPAGSNEEGPSG